MSLPNATQVATVHVEGLHDQAAGGGGAIGAFVFHDIAGVTLGAGYVSPNFKTLRMRHVAEIKRIKGQKGLTTGLISNDEALECTFDFVTEGTSRANAALSARLPPVLSYVSISGLPVIIEGNFVDSLNNADQNNSPWIYEGEGSINGESDGAWEGTITLRRYKGIPTWSASL